MPFEYNRVKLSNKIEYHNKNEYLNASYIKGYAPDSYKTYIAT